MGHSHNPVMAGYGISQQEWDLLTKNEAWNPEERRSVRSALSEVINCSLSMAGLPADALPSEYVAAVIAVVVSPVNRLVAAARTPETHLAVSAAGIKENEDIDPASPAQMRALVMMYTGLHGQRYWEAPRAIEREEARRRAQAG